MTKRPRRLREQWQSLIKQFNDGPFDPVAFCAHHDLGIKNFNKWRLRFARGTHSTPGSFTEVKSTPQSRLVSAGHSPTLRLSLGDARLELPADAPTSRVVELMQALAHV